MPENTFVKPSSDRFVQACNSWTGVDTASNLRLGVGHLHCITTEGDQLVYGEAIALSNAKAKEWILLTLVHRKIFVRQTESACLMQDYNPGVWGRMYEVKELKLDLVTSVLRLVLGDAFECINTPEGGELRVIAKPH